MAKTKTQQAAIAISKKASKKPLRKAQYGQSTGPRATPGVTVQTGDPNIKMIWDGKNIVPAGTGKYSSTISGKTYSTAPNTKVPIGTKVDGKTWDGYTYVKKGGAIKAKKNGKVSSMAKKRR
jgi:hypothetical protein